MILATMEKWTIFSYKLWTNQRHKHRWKDDTKWRKTKTKQKQRKTQHRKLRRWSTRTPPSNPGWTTVLINTDPTIKPWVDHGADQHGPHHKTLGGPRCWSTRTPPSNPGWTTVLINTDPTIKPWVDHGADQHGPHHKTLGGPRCSRFLLRIRHPPCYSYGISSLPLSTILIFDYYDSVVFFVFHFTMAKLCFTSLCAKHTHNTLR